MKEIQVIEFETPIVDERGQVLRRERRTARQVRQPLGAGVDLELVKIPGGIFQMGSPGHLGYPDEHPLHPVSVGPFWLGRYPITQAEWRAVMGQDLDFRCLGERNPADRVSWVAAQAFCRRLEAKTGLPFRLPSEAEWEYACRAGTGTPFCYGPTLTTDLANYCGNHTYAAEPPGLYRHTSSAVGSFPPNGFGVYDMHANLWEWCADPWADDYTGAPATAVSREDRRAAYRVMRGGSWHEPPGNCRSAARLKALASEGDDMSGFRVALSA